MLLLFVQYSKYFLKLLHINKIAEETIAALYQLKIIIVKKNKNLSSQGLILCQNISKINNLSISIFYTKLPKST